MAHPFHGAPNSSDGAALFIFNWTHEHHLMQCNKKQRRAFHFTSLNALNAQSKQNDFDLHLTLLLLLLLNVSGTAEYRAPPFHFIGF
mmetsp:Transcript_2206/g.5064  ORF Transcript_2206/g.5064 Transcript_2206/m.5064 type:complete len:87 (-) Transcript_2206:437-697(-)